MTNTIVMVVALGEWHAVELKGKLTEAVLVQNQ